MALIQKYGPAETLKVMHVNTVWNEGFPELCLSVYCCFFTRMGNEEVNNFTCLVCRSSGLMVKALPSFYNGRWCGSDEARNGETILLDLNLCTFIYLFDVLGSLQFP